MRPHVISTMIRSGETDMSRVLKRIYKYNVYNSTQNGKTTIYSEKKYIKAQINQKFVKCDSGRGNMKYLANT